jgi:acetyltransferase (GNAT) family protein
MMPDYMYPKPNLTYADATPEDAELLSAIAFDSKKFWGYPDELMALWKTDLEINHEYILENKVVKVLDAENFIGFFALKFAENGNVELDHLWLKPEHIKRSYGREIFKYIIDYLSTKTYHTMTLIAEPNATGFYEKMNGKVSGRFESKISGRFLDIYAFEIIS